MITDFIERIIRTFIIFITNYLPVKVIRDDKGVPFLYRYHIFTLGNDGPGMCIHHFVKSDPERGYHDHPWRRAVSFILCGRYDERILKNPSENVEYDEYPRNRWSFNWLNGVDNFHRVMIKDGGDAWTIFAFQKRSKTWGMVSLLGEYKPMSDTVTDKDGGWWNHVAKGLGLHQRLPIKGNVIATVDTIVLCKDEILLIKRGKEPYKGLYALPGGRIEQKDDDILTAALRELQEETNLSDVELRFVTVVGDSKRDPRGFCLTCVFACDILSKNGVKAGDDAVDYEWFKLDDLHELAFDHESIIRNNINAIRGP